MFAFIGGTRTVIFMLNYTSSERYSSVEDFASSADYLNYILGNSSGTAYRCYLYPNGDKHTFVQRGFNTSRMAEQDFSGFDVYFTPNTFVSRKDKKKSCNREQDCIKRLNALYVDLDVYKVGMSASEVAYEVQTNLSYLGLPLYTFLISSGRGLYLIWKLNDEDGYINAVHKRWHAVEDYFISQLECFGADRCVSDSSRVLRVPFSFNSKSGSMVTILDFNDVSYSLYDLCMEYCPSVYDKPIKKPICKDKPKKVVTSNMIFASTQIAEALGVPTPDFNDFKATYGFLNEHKDLITKKSHKVAYDNSKKGLLPFYASKVLSDIDTLMSIRYGNEEHSRELSLFLYRLFSMRASNNAQEALQATLRLNASFSSPLAENEVIKATESAEKRYEKYNYSSKKISALLEITDAEALCLGVLPSKGGLRKNGDGGLRNKACRPATRKKHNRAYYERTLEKNNKVTKSTAISSRRDALSRLFAEGKSADEIMSELSISRSTLYRDMSYLGLSFEERSLDSSSDDKVASSCSFPHFSFLKKSVSFFKRGVKLEEKNEVPKGFWFFRFTLPKGWMKGLDSGGGGSPP